MADKIALSTDVKKKVLSHIEKHWTIRECPICRSSKWHLQPGGIIHPIAETGTGGLFVQTTDETPTIQALCLTCFFVHTFLLMPIINGLRHNSDMDKPMRAHKDKVDPMTATISDRAKEAPSPFDWDWLVAELRRLNGEIEQIKNERALEAAYKEHNG